MLKTLPATYIKINMPGVFCVEKTFHRIGNGSSYAGLFLYSVMGSGRNCRQTYRCIRKYEPVLSVSIHQNSYSDPGVKGPQVFYYEDSESGKALALAIQESMNRKLSIVRPRVAKGNRTYYLLKRSPGVINIVECGFLTNPEEASLLQTEKYQCKVAEAVADGIVTYLEKQKENEKN